MFLIENEDFIVMEDYLFSVGVSKDHTVYGFCFWDRYCWTNVFGFEKL